MTLSTVLPVLLCVWTLVQNINGQRVYSTPASKLIANVTLCPFMLPSPSLIETYFGKRAVFTVLVEAKLDPPLDARWQRIKNGRNESINIFGIKYDESQHLPSPKLVINDADFNDVGYYQLQVRIVGGWCTSRRVELRKVWGILQYNDRCNLSRECDERRNNLRCLISKCLCQSSYYHQNQTCFPKSNLRAVFLHSNITTSEINVKWRHPATDSDLIQSYTVTIRDYDGSTRVSISVGRQTSYSSKSSFDPGHLYYFKVTSTIQLTDPEETTYVSIEKPLVVEPLPPGAIDRNTSNFHPEKLHLKWTAPENRTRVDRYRINIGGYNYYSSSTETPISRRLEPGRNYTVTIIAESWHRYSYGRSSKPYVEEIKTLRTPKVIITGGRYVYPLYLSTLEIKASLQNFSDFPPTLETRWQRNGVDINITDVRYNGSSLDLFNPKLVINRVDFDHEYGTWYRCTARNSEGLGTSTFDTWVYVKGSIQFLEPCNKTRECLESRSLTCRNNKCLCDSSSYHRNKVCYSRSYLQAQSVHVQSSTCDMTITWQPPYRDQDLVSGYQVITSQYNGITSETVSVGNKTEYTTSCKLQPGRRYRTYIRSKIQLSDPKQEINVDSGSYFIILEPLKPGPILRSLSNFSADNLYLRWEASGQNSFVSRYRVMIGNRSQYTTASVPEIYWEELLMSVTLYNVTITAISYGYITNYPSYGWRESSPSNHWIETIDNVDGCVNNYANCSINANCSGTIGSYKCSCISGYIGDGYTCEGCRDFTFGEQCSEACSCIVNNTINCDAVTGICACNTGWEAFDCSQDVNECKEKIIECDTSLYQVCVNIPGSAKCECRFGGLNITDCNHPKPPHRTNQTEVKIKTEATFYIKINRVEFLTNSEKWREGFEISLMKFYQTENVRGFSTILILTIRQPIANYGGQQSGGIRQESVIIDYEIIGSEKESSKLKTDLATSMGKLLSGKKKIKVLDQAPVIKDITIKDSNGAPIENISVSSSPCSVFKGFGGTCSDGEICDDSLGIASCVKVSSPLSDKTILILATGVSIPVLMIIIAVLITCLYCQRKSKHLENTISKRVENLESKMRVNNESDLKLKSDLSNYDSIDSTTDGNTNEYCELSDVPRHFYANTKDEGHSYANYTSDSFYDMPFTNE